MIPGLKLELAVIACFALQQLAICFPRYQSPHCSSNKAQSNLDTSMLRMLRAQMSLEDFVRGMRVRIEQIHETHKTTKSNMKDLYDVYNAIQNLDDEPCNIDRLRVLSEVDAKYRAMKCYELKKVFFSLIKQQPGQQHALKCVDELDSIAQQAFAGNEPATQLMGVVATLIRVPTRSRMVFNLLERDINDARLNNQHFRALIEARHEYTTVCEVANSNDDLQRMGFIFGTILASSSNSLRTPSVVRLLREQLNTQQPNAIKVLCLQMLCRSLQSSSS